MLSWCCDVEGPLLSPLLLVLAMRGVKGLAFAFDRVMLCAVRQTGPKLNGATERECRVCDGLRLRGRPTTRTMLIHATSLSAQINLSNQVKLKQFI